MKEIIEKYFRSENVRYFHPADIIADEHYIRYEWHPSRVIITIGCNSGEVPVFVCATPEHLEDVLRIILK